MEVMEDISNEAILDRVKSNDPSLTAVKIPFDRLIQNIDVYRQVGGFIGENEHIRELKIHDGVSIDFTEHFFRLVSRSKSIQKIGFLACSGLPRGFTNFSTRNQLKCIQISVCQLELQHFQALVSALFEFDSLKEFTLNNCEIIGLGALDERKGQLLQALSRHSGLKRLLVSNSSYRRENMQLYELEGLFSNPSKSLVGPGCTSRELEVLDLSGNFISDLDSVRDMLLNPECKLAELNLSNNDLDNESAFTLAAGLSGNRSVTKLYLGMNEYVTGAGWEAICKTVHENRLEGLELDNNTISDAAVRSLCNSLVKNSHIKILNLSDCDITDVGWSMLFTCLERGAKRTNKFCRLRSFGLGLEELCVCGASNLCDAAMQSLANCLANSQHLKKLNLNLCEGITTIGWSSLFEGLRSPFCVLEELHTGDIDKAAVTSLAEALSHNTSLRSFSIAYNDLIAFLPRVLCNPDSIMDTFTSNHTLSDFYCNNEYEGIEGDGSLAAMAEGDDSSDDISLDVLHREFLRLNEENSISQAARRKIVLVHFGNGFISQPFIDFESTMLPHAMAWMGRGAIESIDIHGHFYEYIKSVTTLFEDV